MAIKLITIAEYSSFKEKDNKRTKTNEVHITYLTDLSLLQFMTYKCKQDEIFQHDYEKSGGLTWYHIINCVDIHKEAKFHELVKNKFFMDELEIMQNSPSLTLKIVKESDLINEKTA